jgi:hypothetical protein
MDRRGLLMIEVPQADLGRVATLFERDGPNSTVAHAVLEGEELP